MNRPIRCHLLVRLALIGVLVPLAGSALAERVPATNVAPRGPAVNVFAVDQQGFRGPTASRPTSPAQPEQFGLPPVTARPAWRGDIGGDDVIVDNVNRGYGADLAIASDGTLFAILWWSVDGEDGYLFDVRRSTDGGTTWATWATFDDPRPGYRLWYPTIHVAEGTEDRVFVAYALDPDHGRATELYVAWSPLHEDVGDFGEPTLVYAGDYVRDPSFTTDHDAYAEYYAYLVWSADTELDGSDIWFARSVDQGTSWQDPYALAVISVADRGYFRPDVTVGYGGWVHVVWSLEFPEDHEFDGCLRYRRAPDWAGGGLASWEDMQSLSSHLNGIHETSPEVATTGIGDDLMIACDRTDAETDFVGEGLLILASDDAGASWSTSLELGSGRLDLHDLFYQPSNSRWILGRRGASGGWGIQTAPLGSPTAWSAYETFDDGYDVSGGGYLVLDPAHDERIGALGICSLNDGTFDWLFDAEWRSDPGYPVTEAGFPVDLPHQPQNDPAIVDLDGDGDLEIVFTSSHSIYAYEHDGSLRPGFPVDVGHVISFTPAAVGDLDGDGSAEIVVGTQSGLIYAYDADGQLLPGWPYDTGFVNYAHVMIGAIGGPYPRAVVWGCGPRLFAIDYTASSYPGVLGRGFGALDFQHPPAVGDLDGDGHSEVVVGIGSLVYAFDLFDPDAVFGISVGSTVCSAVTLGDLDLDGDLEVVVPTLVGNLHVFEHDGTERAGWPQVAADSPLSGCAIAQCQGSLEPEIAVTAAYWTVNLFHGDGEVAYGFPVQIDNWFFEGDPVIGKFTGNPEVIACSTDHKVWAWTSVGELNPGWPKVYPRPINLAPAYGDLDLDGRAEVVVLTYDQLSVLDVGDTPSSNAWVWGMAGHDAERSGCADCVLDVTPVGDDPERVTRVAMAAPHPNPIAGQATFAFAVPVRARVELTVHDVRGRRVALVTREEVAAGRHTLTWNGHDRDGRPLPSGQYLARLRVDGPGLRERLTRKITVLR